MNYIELKDKAAIEGVKIKIEEYRYAYAFVMGESREESFIMAKAPIDERLEKIEKESNPDRRKKAPKPTTTNFNAQASLFHQKEGVQWLIKQLTIDFPEKVRKYLNDNKLAESFITTKIANEAATNQHFEKLSYGEIEHILTKFIRDVGDADPTEISVKEKLSIVQTIKLMLDKFRPVDNTQKDVDSLLVEVYPPYNGICQHCRREVTIDMLNPFNIKLFKEKYCNEEKKEASNPKSYSPQKQYVQKGDDTNIEYLDELR